MKEKILPPLFLISIFLCASLSAQNEIATERFSLTGISKFGISVNIEKPIGLKTPNLQVADIERRIEENFESLPVTILSFNELKESFFNPLFYVHINIMQVNENVYPFSIEMRFYQPVKLILKNDVETMASTWDMGYVGLVTQDRLGDIVTMVLEVSNEFKEDLEKLN